MTKIILDCFGGDNSPDANIGGAVLALGRMADLHLVLTGDGEIIRRRLADYEYDAARVEIVHAPDVVGCDEKPTDAIRMKKDSSLVRAINMLREDDGISGMVSVGSTGALVAGAVLRIGRLRGVIRPAFCPILPTMNGRIVGICDSGANVECTPDYFEQFAVMGSLYMELCCGVENPKAALLNVGVEAEKGDSLHKEAYEILSKTPGINFCGNMESRDLLSGKYDLVVCDGFSGNILIKSTEGACYEMLKKIKRDIEGSFVNKLGALFMYRMFKREKEFMNYERYGGSVMLGTKKTVVKGHGSSKSEGIAKCIEQAYMADVGNFTARCEEALCALPSAKL